MQPIEGVAYYALVQPPIISSGDVCGSVMFLQNKERFADFFNGCCFQGEQVIRALPGARVVPASLGCNRVLEWRQGAWCVVPVATA